MGFHTQLNKAVERLSPRQKNLWKNRLRPRDDVADHLVARAKDSLDDVDTQLYAEVYTFILQNLNDATADDLAQLYSKFNEYQTMRSTDMTERLLVMIEKQKEIRTFIDTFSK